MTLIAVETEELEKKFQEILSEGWKENNWVHLPVKGEDFLIKNSKDQYIATLTIQNYSSGENSFVNEFFEFYKVEPIRDYQSATIELDNFTILKNNRGKGMKAIIECFKSIINYLIEKEEYKYCVVIVKPKFFRALKLVLKDVVQSLSEPFYNERDQCYFVPIYIDVDKIRENTKSNALLRLVSTYDYAK